MTYEQAVKGCTGHVSQCSDAEWMAGFLDSTAQILLLGAVSPKLIWQGAQAKGLTTKELAALIHDDPDSVRELMWA